MSSKSKTEYRVGVGASSILMVLVVLALTAVSLLSYKSAKNAEVLTHRNLQMTTAYYDASAEVQMKLAAVDVWAAELAAAGGEIDVGAFLAKMEELDMAEAQAWEEGNGICFSFVEDASHERHIQVEGKISAYETVRCEISRHQLVSQPAEEDFEQFQIWGG